MRGLHGYAFSPVRGNRVAQVPLTHSPVVVRVRGVSPLASVVSIVSIEPAGDPIGAACAIAESVHSDNP